MKIVFLLLLLLVVTLLLQNTLFTGRWWLSDTPQGAGVNTNYARAHTHTHTSLLLTNTTNSMSLSPLSHHPWPHLTLSPQPDTSAAPPSLLCECAWAYINVCMRLDMCVLDRECTHISSFSHLKYGRVCPACISWLISLAENLGRCWWKKQRHK